MDAAQSSSDYNRGFPDAAKCFELRRRGREGLTLTTMRQFDDMARRQYAGPWHNSFQELGTRNWQDRRPVNPLGEAIRSYIPHLVGPIRPKLTPGPTGSRMASMFKEVQLQRQCVDSKLDEVFEEALIDAMFSVGIIYTGRKAGPQVYMIDEDEIDPGQPFVCRVPLGSFFCDPNADRFSEAAYMGHDYVADRNWVRQLGIGDTSVIDEIPGLTSTRMEVTTLSTQRSQKSTNDEEYIGDPILLSEFHFMWLGEWYCCVLGPDEGPEKFVIKPYKYQGPDLGAYEFIEFDRLPGSLQAVSPAAVLMDAHLSQSGIAARLVRQVETTRRKVVVDPAEEELAMRLKNVVDDEIIFGRSDKANEVTFGGMVEEMVKGFAFFDSLMQRMGPSVNLIGGKADPGGTATGTSLLAGAAQVQINRWKGVRDKAGSSVCKRLAWFMDTPMEGPVPVPVPLPSGRQVTVNVDPNDPRIRDTSWQDFEFGLYPFSPPAMDPRMLQASVAQLIQVLPAFLQMVVSLRGDPSAALAALSNIWGWQELTQIIPTQDAAQLRQAIAQYQTQRQIGPIPSLQEAAQVGKPQTRLAQMRSDYAPGVPGLAVAQ